MGGLTAITPKATVTTMNASSTFDVIIIGAGACGGTTAYFLSLEGLSVALFDQGSAAREASWASAGMIGPQSSPPRDPWFLKATTLSRELYDRLDVELFEQTGRQIGYGGEGALLFARSESEAGCLGIDVEIQTAAGVPTHLLDGPESRKREPALPDDVAASVWWPESRFLDARTYTATVVRAAVLLGATLHEGVRITGLASDGDRVIGVQSGGEVWHAGIVINAGGAWAGRVDPRLTHPVFPYHGQIMAVAGPSCGLRHNVSRVGRSGYATPRADGQVVVGATHDTWGYQKKITPAGMGDLASIVVDLLPCLEEMPVLDVWSGLRPGTEDGLATIGPDPRLDGGYLWGAGHSAAGMMQMPATAAVLTDLVLDRPPRIPIGQLRFERYLKDLEEPTEGGRAQSQVW